MAEQYAQQPHRSYLYQPLEHAGTGTASEGEPSHAEAVTRHLPILPPIFLPTNGMNHSNLGAGSVPHQQVPASPAIAQDTSPTSSSPKPVSSGKSFQCTGYEGCSMSFSRSEHLARHVRKHTGEKPFPCRCGKKFTRLDNLRQHASTIHADEAEANEELFTRLAAHMPRSGQRARRQSAQVKSATSSTSVAGSPSVFQDGFPHLQQPSSTPSTFQSPSSASPTFQSSTSSDAYRFFPNSPLSASSATFRFPPTSNSPVHTFRASAYEGYASQSSSQGWPSGPPHPEQSQQTNLQPSSPKRFPPNTTFSPVPASGGGSQFRSYVGSTTIFEPTRVESSRATTAGTRGYLSHLSGTDTSPATSPVGRSSPRPVLPSLSSLIADAPAISFPTASFAKHRPYQRAPAPLQNLSSAAQLDKALLVAVELAIGSPTSSTRESFEGEELPQTSGRSFSFSSDVSVESLGYVSSSPISTAVPSPPSLNIDSFSPNSSPVKAFLPQRCHMELYRQRMC